ncbi:MAG TPA: DNA methyltransferase [Ktedonobacteraceae bacterium]|nr:DNA methyltransferase [Ktedonobacteraceae bacterium]
MQETLPFFDIATPKPVVLMPHVGEQGKAENVEPEFYLSPNPYLADFVDQSNPPKPVSEHYCQDISCGKNTYVYDAHTYHTKVPPQGIGLLIDYYTRPGDVVLDPFCGSGMTGVAAVERERKAILCDISPAAAFIAYNLTVPVPASSYIEAVNYILQSTKELEQRLYNTQCRNCHKPTPMLYMVWSYGALCTGCKREFVLWDVARDERESVRESKIKQEFDCPHCNKHLKKRELKRTKRYPVLVGYKCCSKGPKEETASPDEYDLTTLTVLEQTEIPQNLWYPTDPLPKGMNTSQPINAGITTVDKMYTRRALWAMAHLWALICQWPDPEIRAKLLFTFTSLYQRVTVFSEFRFWGGSSNTANYNVPAIMNEQNIFKTFQRKAETIRWYFRDAPDVNRQVRVSTQSACHLAQLPDKSVDYVFTDPPFGGNINYSEMNFLWESWLGTYTNIAEEAIINKTQEKGLKQYEQLLTQSFSEVRRVMKDDAWLTVIFHNSSAQVWNALQKALFSAGFAIRGSQIFDKKHGTFKQFVSDNAVGYDLVLHCRKSLDVSISSDSIKQATEQQAINFILQAMRAAPYRYVVQYLHVTRENEIDYRRLYSEWLAHTLPTTAISLSFEQFRVLVDRAQHLLKTQEQ